ncbi:hypothetical protein AALC75_25805 [Lachnospiraceae bacterium 48-42]
MEFKWLNESAINKTGDRWEITAPKESDFFVIMVPLEKKVLLRNR